MTETKSKNRNYPNVRFAVAPMMDGKDWTDTALKFLDEVGTAGRPRSTFVAPAYR